MAEELEVSAQGTANQGVQPDEAGYITCTKCKVRKTAKDGFFSRKDGSRQPICKECLTAFIDNQDRSTFEWILEMFDVPYIEERWITIYNRVLKKKGKVARDGVIGLYLRDMKMQQYKKYTYADTVKLEYEYNKAQQEIAARRAAENPQAQEELLKLQEQLDRGEISQAQFDTLSPITLLEEEHTRATFETSAESFEDDLMRELTDDEVKMLRKKWGATYKPSQWIAMEEKYIEYENEFELDADRKDCLKQICKIYLKMNEALDIGDLKGHRDLSATYETLRKSANFTKQQNKEDQVKYLDSIGELVAFCEREGGIIEQIPHPDDYPQDQIDYAIKNMKSYYYDLVTNELGLGNMIESYIKRLENSANSDEIDMNEGLITSKDEMDELADAIEEQQFEESIFDSAQNEIDKLVGDA